MDKAHGGSSRLSTPIRQRGGDSNVFLNKSSKKEKIRRLSSIGILGEMDQLSHSKKFLDHTSATRKPRSDSKDCTRETLVTKDEEEVAEALFALAQTYNKTSELQPVETVHVEPPNKADVISHENRSRKRCWVHVYICHFIKADVTGVKCNI